MESEYIFHFAMWDTLGNCMKSFPEPAEINPSEIATGIESHSKASGCMQEAFEDSQKAHRVSLRTIRWLEHEGFIFFESIQGDFYNAILTHKGLKAVESEYGGNKKFREIFTASLIGATTTKIIEAGTKFIANAPLG